MPGPFVAQIYVTLADGADTAAFEPHAEAIAVGLPEGRGAGPRSSRTPRAGQIDQILGLVYAMLLLAIFIALLGIANTLSLSVYERTHEFGLLRAVGMTRGQLRSSVRWESVIIALFGTPRVASASCSERRSCGH